MCSPFQFKFQLKWVRVVCAFRQAGKQSSQLGCTGCFLAQQLTSLSMNSRPGEAGEKKLVFVIDRCRVRLRSVSVCPRSKTSVCWYLRGALVKCGSPCEMTPQGYAGHKVMDLTTSTKPQTSIPTPDCGLIFGGCHKSSLLCRRFQPQSQICIGKWENSVQLFVNLIFVYSTLL